jgi:antitoxin (DNA-binding transcriptional repressor) of toxin-antitoxin stability system
MSAMATIGARDAKTYVSELLDRVERREEIAITRRGRPVAKLSRTGLGHDVAAARATAAALLELREAIAADGAAPFSLAEILAAHDAGRR